MSKECAHLRRQVTDVVETRKHRATRRANCYHCQATLCEADTSPLGDGIPHRATDEVTNDIRVRHDQLFPLATPRRLEVPLVRSVHSSPIALRLRTSEVRQPRARHSGDPFSEQLARPDRYRPIQLSGDDLGGFHSAQHVTVMHHMEARGREASAHSLRLTPTQGRQLPVLRGVALHVIVPMSDQVQDSHAHRSPPDVECCVWEASQVARQAQRMTPQTPFA